MATNIPWWSAKTKKDFEIMYKDAIVYEPYTPQRVGKIIDIIFPKGKFDAYQTAVKVRWLKQTEKFPDKETVVRAAHLNSFADLVEDHHRKYKNHKKTLEKAQKL
jgi:hypothetical protein